MLYPGGQIMEYWYSGPQRRIQHSGHEPSREGGTVEVGAAEQWTGCSWCLVSCRVLRRSVSGLPHSSYSSMPPTSPVLAMTCPPSVV